MSYNYSNVSSGNEGALAALGAVGIVFLIIGLVVGILMLVSIIKIFKKCKKPAIASIIPIWNTIVMCEIAEKPWWYIILLCIPLVNIYAMFVIYSGIAKKFGKTTGFAIGMMLIPIIFFPILGFKENVVDDAGSVNIEQSNTDITQGANVEQNNMNEQPVQNVMEQNGAIQTPVAEPLQNNTVENSFEPTINETVEQQSQIVNNDMMQAPIVNNNQMPIQNQNENIMEQNPLNQNEVNVNIGTNENAPLNNVDGQIPVNNLEPQKDNTISNNQVSINDNNVDNLQ